MHQTCQIIHAYCPVFSNFLNKYSPGKNGKEACNFQQHKNPQHLKKEEQKQTKHCVLLLLLFFCFL